MTLRRLIHNLLASELSLDSPIIVRIIHRDSKGAVIDKKTRVGPIGNIGLNDGRITVEASELGEEKRK